MNDISIKQIMMWDSNIIPENWQICDGTNGTPDLRDSFIYGASINTDLGVIGGENSHFHTLPISSTAGETHSHSFSVSFVSVGGSKRTASVQKYSYGEHTHSYSGNTTSSDNSHAHSSTLSLSSSVPPCVLLYYIMKVA